MRLLPFLERAIAATLWTLAAGTFAIVIGLVIGSYSASTRAEGVALGLWYGQLIVVALCPVVLWWRVYRTMWLRGPGRGAEASEHRVETNSSRSLERKRPIKAHSKPPAGSAEPTAGAEKSPSKREPRVSREPSV
jgi:hypothetical protein